MEKNNTNWLRWISVIPVSIIVYFAVNLIIGFVFKVQNIFESDSMEYWIGNVITPLLRNGFSSYCLIVSASLIIPSHKKISLSVVFILFCLFWCYKTYSDSLYQYITNTILMGIVNIIGLSIAYIQLKETLNKEQKYQYDIQQK